MNATRLPTRLPTRRHDAGTTTTVDALTTRWRGECGRLEVWYATFGDPDSGFAGWIHHELVAPVASGPGGPKTHGWVALFEPGAPPVFERFGPDPVDATTPLAPLLAPPVLTGHAGDVRWDLHLEVAGSHADAGALFTFPAWAWERQVLPGAQVLPVPHVPVSGTIRIGDAVRELSPRATGNLAHIYGHGNAERWGWLHAALPDEGVLEIVSAVSRRPGLNHLPPLAFVQLRLGGRDWPRDPLVAAPLFRTSLGLPEWSVRGTVGRWRLRVDVRIPPDNRVEVGYVDPDGATATCTNSEVASADIVLEHRRGRWETERTWKLDGTAHAEIGRRP